MNPTKAKVLIDIYPGSYPNFFSRFLIGQSGRNNPKQPLLTNGSPSHLPAWTIISLEPQRRRTTSVACNKRLSFLTATMRPNNEFQHAARKGGLMGGEGGEKGLTSGAGNATRHSTHSHSDKLLFIDAKGCPRVLLLNVWCLLEPLFKRGMFVFT